MLGSAIAGGVVDHVITSFLDNRNQNAQYGNNGNFDNSDHQSLFDNLKNQVLGKIGMSENDMNDNQRQDLQRGISDGMHEHFQNNQKNGGYNNQNGTNNQGGYDNQNNGYNPNNAPQGGYDNRNNGF